MSEQLNKLRKKLAEYQKKYGELKKQSPDRWWHDEYFDIQLRVLEVTMAEIKEEIRVWEKEKKAG